MNIERRYWKWNESIFLPSDLKLGNRIEEYLVRGLVKRSEEDQFDFSGLDRIPWRIEVANGFITAIFFRETFFHLPNGDIWDLELRDFEREMNKIFQPVDENYCGDKLSVVFRDFFVAIAGIIRPGVGSGSQVLMA